MFRMSRAVAISGLLSTFFIGTCIHCEAQAIPGSSPIKLSGSYYWSSIAYSADGSHLIGCIQDGDIWTSTDNGATWTDQKAAGSKKWQAIACSEDGSHVVASVENGNIWTSADHGAAWTERVIEGGSFHASCISYSADGSHIVAGGRNGVVAISADGGDTWSKKKPGGPRSFADFQRICNSADGSFIAACGGGNGPDMIWRGNVYVSMDGGSTWTESQTGKAQWNGIACSADGSRVAADMFGWYVLTSESRGATWTERTASGKDTWRNIACSADGSRIAVCALEGYISLSVDGGATWNRLNGPKGTTQGFWQSITMSADGSYIAACTFPRRIMTDTRTLSTKGVVWTSSDGGLSWVDRTGD